MIEQACHRKVFITTEDVIATLKLRDNSKFTTIDIAKALHAQFKQDCNPAQVEYSVRAAVSWLAKRGYIERTTDTVKRYTRNGEPYWSSVYKKGGKIDSCVSLLLDGNWNEKACTKCGETKPLSEFGPHRTSKDGYDYWCRECKYECLKRWRANRHNKT